jgi:hypothetical protein
VCENVVSVGNFVCVRMWLLSEFCICESVGSGGKFVSVRVSLVLGILCVCEIVVIVGIFCV